MLNTLTLQKEKVLFFNPVQITMPPNANPGTLESASTINSRD